MDTKGSEKHTTLIFRVKVTYDFFGPIVLCVDVHRHKITCTESTQMFAAIQI
jgi:hypothetical protein